MKMYKLICFNTYKANELVSYAARVPKAALIIVNAEWCDEVLKMLPDSLGRSIKHSFIVTK